MVTISQLKNGAREKRFLKHNPSIFRMSTKTWHIMRLDTISQKNQIRPKEKLQKYGYPMVRCNSLHPGYRTFNFEACRCAYQRRCVPDLPGVRYHLFRHKLDFTSPEHIVRSARRSKFNTKLIKREKPKK